MKRFLTHVVIGVCIGVTAQLLGLDELYWRAITLAVLAIVYNDLGTWMLEE